MVYKLLMLRGATAVLASLLAHTGIPRLKFLIGQQLIKICNGARQTLLKHSAGLSIEQLLGARNVGPALLRIVLRPQPVNRVDRPRGTRNARIIVRNRPIGGNKSRRPIGGTKVVGGRYVEGQSHVPSRRDLRTSLCPHL